MGEVHGFRWDKIAGDAVPISGEHRTEWAREAKAELDANPDEPFCFRASGDSFVIALRCGDEIFVFDTLIRREAWFIEKKETAK